MKKIDNIGLKLCEYQSNLFEKSVDFFDCSSVYFVKVFMNSDFVKRIDQPSFLLESIDIYAAFNELKEYHKFNRGNEKYPSYVMKWIGYIYRYFVYTQNFSSKRVYEIVKPKELFSLYESYHSLDPKEVVERIMESKQIKGNPDLIELAKKFYL